MKNSAQPSTTYSLLLDNSIVFARCELPRTGHNRGFYLKSYTFISAEAREAHAHRGREDAEAREALALSEK